MIDQTLVADLKQLENRINTNEHEAIFARWDCGRRILKFYATGRKQLANGLLDAIAAELGVCRAEVGARIKFARKFPKPDEVSTLVETYKSWSAIRQQALSDKHRASSNVETRPLQRAWALVRNIDPVTLDDRDLPLIAEFNDHLARLGANIVTLRAA
jgi:hypothetical protein